jgi:phenylacetate-CoA ligase
MAGLFRELDDAGGRPAGRRDPEELRALQLGRLNALLSRAAANAFHGPRLRAAGVGPEGLRSLDELRGIPPIRKADLLADNQAAPPWGRRLQIPPERIAHAVETSGTSGVGKELHAMSAADEAAIAAVEADGFRMAGVRPGSVVMNTVPMALSAAGVWYYLGLKLAGANVFEIGTFGARRKLDAIARFGCDLLIGTPSYIDRLEAAAREEGRDPRALGVRAILVAGEPFSIPWVRRLEAAWGARLFEQYGCTQRATAWTCERGALDGGDRRGVLHFVEDACCYEVLDPATGEPVGPGAEGELVVTPFIGEATPIIRFATGDRVRRVADAGCPCGRTGGGIQAGSVNRYDNMVKVRGVNVWPEAVDEIVFRQPGVADYLAEVFTDEARGVERVRVTVEFGAGDPAQRRLALAELEQRIQEGIGIRVEVAEHAGPPLIGAVPDEWFKRTRWRDRRRPARLETMPR